MRHLGGIISLSTIRKRKCKKLGRGGELNSQDKKCLWHKKEVNIVNILNIQFQTFHSLSSTCVIILYKIRMHHPQTEVSSHL